MFWLLSISLGYLLGRHCFNSALSELSYVSVLALDPALIRTWQQNYPGSNMLLYSQ